MQLCSDREALCEGHLCSSDSNHLTQPPHADKPAESKKKESKTGKKGAESKAAAAKPEHKAKVKVEPSAGPKPGSQALSGYARILSLCVCVSDMHPGCGSHHLPQRRKRRRWR